MELSSQFAGLAVGGVNTAGSRLKSKRSQRFTVPVQPPNPAASPPFSNSTSEDSGPTTGTGSGSSFSLTHSDQLLSNGQPSYASYSTSSNNDAALFPPPSNFAQTQGGTSGATNINPNHGINGQIEHSFLQQDPFAFPSAPTRTRTLSSGSSSASHHHQHQQQQHQHQHQHTGSLSANGIWADQPNQQQSAHQQQHQQRTTAPYESFNINQNPRNSPFNGAPPFSQRNMQQLPPPSQQQPSLRQQFNNIGQNGGQAAPGPDNNNTANSADDIIPTAIVIKNIPFNFPSTSLLQIIEELTLAPPYAFNYHYDMGVFRGLAFANFHTPQETDSCVVALNGFEIQGRKLRVEYKKVLQAGEKERIERDKAIKRMRSMQLDRERILQQQQAHMQHLQQQIFGGQQGPLPPHLQQQQINHFQQQQQQQNHGIQHFQNQMAPGHQHQQSQDDFEDYGRAVHPSNSMFNQPMMSNNSAFSPPMEFNDSYPSQRSGTSGSGASSSSRTGSGSSMPTELDMNDGQTLELYSRVLLFKEDALRDELAFSKALSNVQRRIVHLIAQKLNLDHRSTGSGEDRYVIVSKPGSNTSSMHQQQQQPQQQQRSLRTRASAYPMLNPDPYAPPQPSLLPDGMNLQGFSNAMRKKSMPDLRHQQQHPLYSNPEYQQYSFLSGQQGHSISPPLSSNPSSSGQNITPRHSTNDLRAVAASASSRRSMYMHTAAPGENNTIPPVPALPPNLLQQNGLPSNAATNTSAVTPTSAPLPRKGVNSNDRQSIIFGSGSIDLNDIPKTAAASVPTSTLSLDSKIVGSPVKSDSNGSNTGGVVRQPRGPDNTSSWPRNNAITSSGSL